MNIIGMQKKPIRLVEIDISTFEAFLAEKTKKMKLKSVSSIAIIKKFLRIDPLFPPFSAIFMINRQKKILPKMPIPLYSDPSVP